MYKVNWILNNIIIESRIELKLGLYNAMNIFWQVYSIIRKNKA